MEMETLVLARDDKWMKTWNIQHKNSDIFTKTFQIETDLLNLPPKGRISPCGFGFTDAPGNGFGLTTQDK